MTCIIILLGHDHHDGDSGGGIRATGLLLPPLPLLLVMLSTGPSIEPSLEKYHLLFAIAVRIDYPKT